MSSSISSIGAIGPAEAARWRLVAQRLVGPALESPEAVVRWLSAVQAQDLPGALTSVAIRTSGRSREAVRKALDAGQVVRSWPMRGTLHLVAAEQLGWMLTVAADRQIQHATARRDQLGLDEPALARAQGLAETALAAAGEAGGPPGLRRNELVDVWQRAGIDTAQQRGYHLIHHFAVRGVLCFGPMAGREQLIVPTERWIPHPERLDRDGALGRWVRDYFASHGPATLKDFARWTGLPMADARTGLAVARPELATVTVDGVECLLDPATPDLAASAGREIDGVLLLPGFDEFLLGYADRSAQLDPAFAARIVPGGNGVFKPTVVVAGRVVGIWSQQTRRGARTVTPAPFSPLSKRVDAAVAAAAKALPDD